MAIIIRGSTAATVGEPILTGVLVGVFTIRGMTHGIMVMLGSTIPGTVLGTVAIMDSTIRGTILGIMAIADGMVHITEAGITIRMAGTVEAMHVYMVATPVA